MRTSRRKLYLRILYVFFLALSLVTVNSCRPALSREDRPVIKEEIEKPAGNNYKGLRVETLDLGTYEAREFNPKIICFGDSVTFGWNVEYDDSYPRVLKRLLEGDYKQVEVINSGIGGNTVLDAYSRLDVDILDNKPNLVIINFGLNDGTFLKTDENGNKNNTNKSLLDKSKLTPRVDLETFEKTYNDIIGRLEESGTRIMILGTNPILDTMFEDSNYFEKQLRSFEEYNQEARLIAGKNGITFIDLWDIFLKDGQAGYFMAADGIHPNEEGLELIAGSVYSLVKDGSFFQDTALE